MWQLEYVPEFDAALLKGNLAQLVERGEAGEVVRIVGWKSEDESRCLIFGGRCVGEFP